MVLFAVAVAAAVVVGDVDVALDEDATIVIILSSTVQPSHTGANNHNTKNARTQASYKLSSIRVR